MRVLSPILEAAAIAAMFMSACSGGSGKDGGILDASLFDGGGACNPYNGTGCPGGQFCAWKANTDLLACRPLPDTPKGFEQGCDPTLPDCQVGLACTAIAPGAANTCFKICDPQNGAGCLNLVGMSPGYECQAIIDKTSMMNAPYGICLPTAPSCNPLMDMCAANETCTQTPSGLKCQVSGTGAKGDPCVTNGCQKGLVCVAIANHPAACYPPCDPSATTTTCSTGDVCLMLTALNYGVCKTPVRGCDPLNDTCPLDQNCTFQNPDLMCGSAGTSTIGGDCSTEPCARGGVCAILNTTMKPRCFQPCDPTMGMTRLCAVGQSCISIGEPFGVCGTQ
jgi:hypothetical protein